jgi:hypothetical protein
MGHRAGLGAVALVCAVVGCGESISHRDGAGADAGGDAGSLMDATADDAVSTAEASSPMDGASPDAPPAIDAGGLDATSVTDAATDAMLAPDALDLCEQTCAHVLTCTGTNLCAQSGIDCATINPSYSCAEACILGTPCAQLTMATIQACDVLPCHADGGAPADAGAPTDAGAPADAGAPTDALAPTDASADAPWGQACATCSSNSCPMPVSLCAQNAACAPWLQCAETCVNGSLAGACFSACDAMYPGAASLYQPVYACECASCSGPCAVASPCASH